MKGSPAALLLGKDRPPQPIGHEANDTYLFFQTITIIEGGTWYRSG
jgi:hypothetical protein